MIHSNDDEEAIKRRKNMLLIILGSLFFIFSLCIWYISQNSNPPETIRPIKFDFPSDKIDPNVMRIQNLEAQLSVNNLESIQLKNTLSDLIKQIELSQKVFVEQLGKQNEALTHQIDQKINKEKESVLQEVNQQLQTRLSPEPVLFSDDGQQVEPIPSLSSRYDTNLWHRDPLSLRSTIADYSPIPLSAEDGESDKKMKRMLVSIKSQSTSNRRKKFLTNSIPMGESVKAILLSGVDAVCGIYSRGEPIPVKLQLLEQGHLPNKLQSHIKRSVILGSAYGDISSERVIIRLEKLRTLNLDGTYYDTAISGFVTGEDGKYGVRGKVVDRSAKMIKNAATSGFLEELSNLAQASLAKPNVNVSSWSSAPQILGGGVVGGSSRALEMLADYYIKRAEHVQPVLQIDAGRIVDITFSFSVEIGDLDVKERILTVREQSRKEECENL